MRTIHDGLVFLRLLIVILHVGIILEMVGGLAHDVLNPW